jgi:peptidoglycan hydrolase-like protein with peptidoglycan-binding domain
MKQKHILSQIALAMIIAVGSISVSTLPVSAQATDLNDQIPDSSDCLVLTSYLKFGSSDVTTNKQVSILQGFLSESGYYQGAATGYFGSKTRVAVKAFQSANGISPSGYVGALTSAKVKEISCGDATTPAISSDPTPVTPVRFPVVPHNPNEGAPYISSVIQTSNVSGLVKAYINGSNFSERSYVRLTGSGNDQSIIPTSVSESQIVFSFSGVSAGVYNVQVKKGDFMSNSVQLSVNPTSPVSLPVTPIPATPVPDGSLNQTVVFTKDFSMTTISSSTLLNIAADNMYAVTVNGTSIGQSTNVENFYTTTQYDITSAVHLGSNQITITAINKVDSPAMISWAANPGAMLFKITDGNGNIVTASDGTERVGGHASVVIPQNLLHSFWLSFPGARWVWDPSLMGGLI